MILFTAAEKIWCRREWRSALVVKGLGRRVLYIPLARHLNYLWARNGEIQISDMNNDCFLVKFRSQKDYEGATMGGPWLLGDTYLTVHRWLKGFNPWKTVVKSTMVWAQLPELPIEFINKEAVMKIGAWLGKPVRVDRATELGARGKYARVCIEVDLTQPLIWKFKIEGATYLVQYEGLDGLCTDCGTYGKSVGTCHCIPKGLEMETKEVMEEDNDMREDPSQGRTYGEWMKVAPRRRPVGRRDGLRGKADGKYTTNRFQGLANHDKKEDSGGVEEPIVGRDDGKLEKEKMTVNTTREQAHAKGDGSHTATKKLNATNNSDPNEGQTNQEKRKSNSSSKGKAAGEHVKPKGSNGEEVPSSGKGDGGNKNDQKKGEG
ncbi:unnamed protein product [Linum tenue]|uniref:DUF4283 domain-containing protein n=1 Tax=Linum tenue TaxID=586396 RepID=A0AAV0IS52_9ROSI|nr:unnamed protein product [Linum tenue]